MKKTVLSIDGGYLRAIAIKNFGLDPKNYTADFIEQFAWACFDTKKEDPLRILYYDCLPSDKPQRFPISRRDYISPIKALWKDDLPRKTLFAVRLGQLGFRGWSRVNWRKFDRELTDADFKPNYEQKGVDMRMGLDIAAFSYEKMAERIILATGDMDFIPALKMARRAGIQTVLIRLVKPKKIKSLLPHADFLREVNLAEITARQNARQS